ncbi:MAG: hypothetical protein M3Y83_04080 [Actinomycetota bacterium]|nr:hypothetical protein [Actinomycetota bacterium]
MPIMWQNAWKRIRHPASRGGTLMPNTWAAGMNSWLRRYGWPAATRESETAKPSIISDIDMAWLLADAAAQCLTGHERTMTFVELGCREYLPVIKRILNAALACRMTLPESVFDALSRWLNGYAGSPEELQLRTLLAEIRARPLEQVPLRTQQAQCGNVRNTATPVHSVAR